MSADLRVTKPSGDCKHTGGSDAPAPAGGTSLECAFCGEPAEGNYSIHRDGFAVGPEVDLCDACGEDLEPSCFVIWDAIAQPSSESSFAHRPVKP